MGGVGWGGVGWGGVGWGGVDLPGFSDVLEYNSISRKVPHHTAVQCPCFNIYLSHNYIEGNACFMKM